MGQGRGDFSKVPESFSSPSGIQLLMLR